MMSKSSSMKRTHHFSFVEENQNNPTFSGKRTKQVDDPKNLGELYVADHERTIDGCSGWERLKRHQEEVAGRVAIPDTWGQEELLKDWIDCSPFDALLVPKGLASARDALAMEGRRRASSNNTVASQGVMRIESRC